MGRASNRKKTQTRAQRGRKCTKEAASSSAVAVDIAGIGVAHHEAAHAVVDSLLGLPLQYVELTVKDGAVSGFTSVPAGSRAAGASRGRRTHATAALDGRRGGSAARYTGTS